MLSILWRGMAVGVTETVPGISGSTVAMITGIYEKLILALSQLTSRQWREALPFLIKFGIGMVLGFALSISLIVYLLDNFRTPTLVFFTGIVVGFLPTLYRETKSQCAGQLAPRHYLIIAVFFAIVALGQLLRGLNPIDLNALGTGDYLFLLIAGGLASTALVLPGISGALVLTILGIYEVATTALKEMQLPVVATIGAGIFAGVLLTSRLVRYLLAHFPGETYAAMVGLVAGSIIALLGNVDPELSWPVVTVSILTFIAGFTLIRFLERFSGGSSVEHTITEEKS